ncbi:endonuclease [Ralstonia solanacearum]|nr:endonuclease [Ralstonia solanacearum]NKG09656.1 endonuclease [Ralstonia solanacearum]
MTTYAEITRQIELLKKEADALRAQEIAAVVKEIREKIAQFALKPEDLFKPAARKSATAGTRVPVRYRDNEGNAWTGRGKRPIWLVKKVAAGAKVEDFLVAA